MRVTYSPDGTEPQAWDYVPAKVKQSEAEMMERRADLAWDDLNKGIMSGAARPRKVLLWHLLRRQHPILRWEDVPDFCMADVQIEMDAAELGRMREVMQKSKELDETTREAVLAAIDDQIAGLPADDAGKALSPISEPPTAAS